MGGQELQWDHITGPWGCSKVAAAIPVAFQAVDVVS